MLNSSPRLAAAALAFCVAACGGDSDGIPDSGFQDAGAGADASTAVSGTSQLVYATETGTRAVSIDLSMVPVSALVPTGETFFEIEGEGESDGSFRITDVPFQSYYLQVGTNYYVTDARRHELAFAKIGRDDVDTLAEATTLFVNATGIESWQGGDTLQLYSAGAGTAAFGLEQLSAPIVGATSISVPVDLSGFAGHAIDASKGDEVFLTQLSQRIDGGGAPYRALSSLLRATDVTIASGQTAPLSGAAEVVTAGTVLAVEWSNASVVPFVGAMAPGASLQVSERVRVLASPVDPATGAISPIPTLADATLPGAVTTEVELSYDNPFSSSWTVIEETRVDVTSTVTAAGGQDVRLSASLVSAGPQGSLADRTAAPSLGPATDLELDGQPADTRLAGVAESPELSWGVPEIGTASGYVVEIFRVAAGSSTSTKVAAIYTVTPGVRIPDGILQQESEYWIRVQALTLSGRNFETDPHRRTIPYALSEATTHLLSR